MAGKTNNHRVSLTTGAGIISFPRVFPGTAGKKDDGSPSYDIQILIPKTDKDSVRAILRAIKEVGEAKWGDNWRKVRTPLRDGDKEKGELTEDGTTKEEKYPERLGHYFINARSTKPVAVVDRKRVPIVNSDELYGGCKGKIAITFYPYSTSGNHGVGVGLDGVQKISDGESFGGGRPSVENMFDALDDDDDDDLYSDVEDEIEDEIEEEPEEKPAPRKRAAVKKAAAPAAKKAAAKRKPEPEPEIDIEEDEDDLYGDLDDLDD